MLARTQNSNVCLWLALPGCGDHEMYEEGNFAYGSRGRGAAAAAMRSRI